MKLLAIFLISPLLAFSQIRIDDVGDGWKGLVEQALKVIETTDTAKYNLVTQYCTQITYGLQPFSTTESDHVIILPTAEMKKGIVEFKGSKQKPGVLALLLPGQKYFDFIYAGEDVSIETSGPDYIQSMVVKTSK